MADHPGSPSGDDPTPLHGSGDPEVERRVRDILARRAESIDPADRFAAIEAAVQRAQPESEPRSRWRWPVVAAAVVVLLVGVVNLPRFIPQQTSTTSAGAGAEGASAPTTRGNPAPADSASDQGSASPGASTSTTTAYAVYYLGSSLQRSDTASAPSPVRLYREAHALPATTSRLVAAAEAITAMATVAPDDADYDTAWPTLGTVEVDLVDGGLRVDLSADGFPAALPNSFTAAEAIQQLVWTATSAYGSDLPVTVLVDGGTNVSWGRELFGRPVSRDAALRSPVWIEQPRTDQTTPAGEVRITGVATSPNGTVGWQIRDAASGDVVDDGTAPAGATSTFAEFGFQVALEPGRYTVLVYAPDLTGANPLGEGDSKTWTVG